MKQEIPTTPPRRPPAKSTAAAAAAAAAASTSRSKAPAKPKDSPKPEAVSGIGRARAPPARQNVQKIAKRPVSSSNKARDAEESCASRTTGMMRRRTEVAGGERKIAKSSGDPDKEKEELKRKVAELESSVANLKVELEAAHRLNAELQSLNEKLSENLRVSTQCSVNQTDLAGDQGSKFEDIQKIIASKLQSSKACKAPEDKTPAARCSQSPPPPPPPTPPRLPQRAGAPGKPPSVFQCCHSSSRPEGDQRITGQMNQYKPVASNAHSSIVGEIKNRSTHLLAIKADTDTKGDFVNGLIQKVQDAAYTDIDDVLNFVNWLDNQLSALADERAVLKHFEWPERKADAMREAAVEYRDLKSLERDVSSYVDDAAMPCEISLKKMVNLLDKSEKRIQRVIKLRSSAKHSYQKFNIPSDWMLDSGLVGAIKQALIKVANYYLKRVLMELQSIYNSDRESTQEALMNQGLQFAYRTYQVAGGLDSETTRALEEIRRRLRGSREI